MRTKILLTVATLALIGGVALWWVTRGPDASQFADIREPRIRRMDNQRMLVVEAVGDPNLVGASVFKLLFSTYFKLDGASKIGRPPAPRARWPHPEDTPKGQWRGQYGLPVSASAALPVGESTEGLRPVITTWTYGDVAEILHVGPYSTEQADIERLRHFIAAQGYRVVGDHEEDYVKGPGMFFAGDPDNYLTVIRLRVEKSSGASG